MAHIVFVIGKLVSLQNAVSEITTRLEEAGHRVTIASMDDIGAAIEQQAIPFVQLQAMGRFDDKGSFVSKWLRIKARREAELAAWQMEDKIEALQALQPDLIVVETELPALVIGLSQLGIPMATIAYFASIYKYPLVPPLHKAVLPGDGWRGTRWGIEWVWLRYRFRLLRDELRRFLRHAGLYEIAMLRHYARQVGFDFRRGASIYEWLIPVTFEAFPMLYPTPLAFDFPHTPHSHIHHLGILVNTRAHTERDADVQTRLEALLAKHKAADGEQKLLYCAFGTAFGGDDSAFIQRVIAAVAEQPTWTLILSLGGRGSVAGLGELPPNVHAFEWVAQWRVLEQADAAIVHAGLATCLECIQYGVPMLSYPFDVNDQRGNAARVAYHQLGLVGQRDNDTPEVIQAHLQQLLNRDHDKLQSMRQTLQHDTPQRMVDIFEEVISSHSER